MKEALKRIVDALHKYNSEHMAAQAFGLSEDIVYDALVIAPSFSPTLVPYSFTTLLHCIIFS